MRKVTEQTVAAFFGGRDRKVGNTQVLTDEQTAGMYLHGNLIALRETDTGRMKVRMAGWGTPTTRERLNGIADWLGVEGFHQKNWTQYHGDVPVSDTEWVTLREGY